ncbi:MAG TPA: nucleotidyltransferase domain-containing protein [Puia sp.]|jgi:predicted nucleotidyltransferase
MTGQMHSWLQRISDQIVYLTDPDEIILFGSFASRKERSDSDIDLVVVVPLLHNRQRMAREIGSFIAEFGVHSDVILLNRSELTAAMADGKSFLSNALKKSIIIYKKLA